jgi:thymidylate synthase
MKQYLNLLERVLNEGTWQQNRTGIPTKRLTGAMLEFDLKEGFPAVTTKKLAFNAVKAELLGFIRGYDNASQFRDLGCSIWDQNANENKAWVHNIARKGEDDLGRIYGVQWRKWRPFGEMGYSYPIDQLANAISTIDHNPESRRIIVTAWNPGELSFMALPPCHMTFQLLVDVDANEVSLCMYQRSCDMFLGIPFNIASYALLLELIAAATGKRAGKLIMFLADVHIYQNHVEQVLEQLKRRTLPLCQLRIEEEFFYRSSDPMKRLIFCKPEDISLDNYVSHLPIKAEMAV